MCAGIPFTFFLLCHPGMVSSYLDEFNLELATDMPPEGMQTLPADSRGWPIACRTCYH